MAVVVTIENGFADVGGGSWLMGRGQPAAFFGTAVRRRRKGWCVRDRGRLDLVETAGAAKCADSTRPFLTHIPCAEPIFAVSGKVLVAPASARRDAQLVKMVPMSARGALCVTEFGEEWVVTATAGRTARVQVPEGETLSVRPEAAVAWTGKRPTGFCPRLSIWDLILPRGPRDLLLTFYGPCLVWIEGAEGSRPCATGRAGASPSLLERRGYGV
ncbi:MAG: hypothetical protein IJ658_08410 [Kiritimatiellae bacterium]|nr:hypothetical protein [Kiritimatiellia bacterium]